jgi:hypothetical protein
MNKTVSRLNTSRASLLHPGEGQEEGIKNQKVTVSLSPLPGPLPKGEGELDNSNDISSCFAIFDQCNLKAYQFAHFPACKSFVNPAPQVLPKSVYTHPALLPRLNSPSRSIHRR